MGYLILLSQVVFLTFLALILKKRHLPAQTIQSYIYAGGGRRPRLIALGTFNTWIWTTSILGATEAGITYGLPGCVAYALGADLGFLTMIFLLLRFYQRKDGYIFLTDLIKSRLSHTSEIFFYGMCIMMVSYTVVQQAVGIANVFTMLWGISYKIIAFLIVLATAVFVVCTGMRGVLWSDAVYFGIIIITLASMTAIIVGGESSQAFKSGFLLAAADLKANLLSGTIKSFFNALLFYILASAIVGASQTVLDPNYYIKASMLENPKTIRRSLLSGGVYLWTPVVILTSAILSSLWRAYMGKQGLESFNTNLLTDVLFARSASLGLKISFSIAMITIAVTTMTNAFIGIVAFMSIRGHGQVTGEIKEEGVKIRFGKLFTLMFALFCSLIAISLENISLFKINIVCGIFFAAPCGVVLFHKYISTKAEYPPVLMTIIGIISGIIIWARLANHPFNLFIGTLVSFLTPVILINLYRLGENISNGF